MLRCNDALKAVFGRDELNRADVQKILLKHLSEIDGGRAVLRQVYDQSTCTFGSKRQSFVAATYSLHRTRPHILLLLVSQRNHQSRISFALLITTTSDPDRHGATHSRTTDSQHEKSNKLSHAQVSDLRPSSFPALVPRVPDLSSPYTYQLIR